MKILIVEDEELAAQRMINLLDEIEPGCVIDGPLDTVSSTIARLKTVRDYDLVFLDIQLADGKSFSIFEAIELNTPVIFTTAYDEYALQAFNMNSIDYLLKPVNKEKLQAALSKFKNLKNYYSQNNPNIQLYEIIKNLQAPMQSNFRDRFLINKGNAMIPVKTREVAYFIAEEKAVMLVTHENKRYIIPHTLDELESKLDPNLFFRVNRQFILSAESIQKVHNYFNFKLKIEVNPNPVTEVIVSRARTVDFKIWMNS